MELNSVTSDLQQALLNSVAHNLRSPLASIRGVLDGLIENGDLLDESTQKSLLRSASDEARRLNRLIENLLDITRLEGGAVHLKVEPADLRDAVAAALMQLGNGNGAGSARIDIPRDLPLIPMDCALISQTLVNLIDNALKYSPEDAPVEIHAWRVGNEIRVSVSDRGPGIPSEDRERVFEKFYSGAGGKGIGLGLSICRGFVEAHGGAIWSGARDDGGAVITFTLPLADKRGDQ